MKELVAFALLLCGAAAAAAYVLTPESVDALVADLEDADAAVRRAAATALATRGEAAREAVPALQEALRDENFAVRVLAGVALTKLGEAGGEVSISPEDAPALVDSLGDRDANVSGSAREGLHKLGAKAIPALVAQLAGADGRVRRAVLSMLAELGSNAASAAPDLARLLDDETDPGIRLAAIDVLGRSNLGPAARDAVPALVKMAEKGDAIDQMNAIMALGKIGPDAAEAVAALTTLRDSADVVISSHAGQALEKIQVPRQ
jgi:HEAT repeat protein